MSLKDVLNTADPNREDDAFRELGIGSVLNLLLRTQTATESGVTVTSSVMTLANQPEFLLDVNATAGTTTGRKKLRKGPITGPQKITPATGECVWDGGKKILFATVDAVTTASALYTQATDAQVSFLQRDAGQTA